MFKIIKNTIWQGLGKAVMVVVGIVTTSLLIKNLGEEKYGVFSLIGSSFLLIDAIAEMGTKMIGVREISKTDNKRKVVSSLIFLRLVTTLLAVGIGGIFLFVYPVFREYRWESILALSMCFWTFMAGNLEIRFQAEERMDKKSLVDSLFPLLFLIFFLVLNKNINLVKVFELYLVARIASLVIGYTMVNKEDRFEYKKIETKLVGKLLKQSLPMGAFLLIFTAYDKAIDSVIIERFLGVTQVAWYGLAYKVYGNLVMPAYFLVTSALPSFTKEKENKNTYEKTLKLAICGSLVVLPIILIIGPWAIRILAGSEFNWQMSGKIFQILSLGLVFSFINHVQGFYLVARDGERKMLFIGIISLIFNLVANLVFVPRFGVMGAAVVTTLTEILMSGMYTVI